MKKLKKIVIKIALSFVVLLGIAVYADQSYALEPDSVKCSVRSRGIIKKFQLETKRIGGWDNHVADHVCALANGGLDQLNNLQWQSDEDGEFKDRIENTPEGRKMFCNEKNSLPYRTVFNSKKKLNETYYCNKLK